VEFGAGERKAPLAGNGTEDPKLVQRESRKIFYHEHFLS